MTEDNSQNPISEWIRVQADFQARLTNETFRYLRRLQGAVAPATPGTVVLPEESFDLNARAVPGGTFEITLEVKNYQRVHAVAAPGIDPLVSSSGTTWYPEVNFLPEFSLIGPDQTVEFQVRVSVPPNLPTGNYMGVLSLRGLRQQVFRFSVEVSSGKVESRTSRPAASTRSAAPPAKRAKAGRASQRTAKTKATRLRKAKRS
jgi:hypothetical protein